MKNINFNISSIREFFLNRLPELISNLDQRVVIAAGATFGLLVTALGIGLTIKLLGNRVKRKAPDSSKSSESETKKSKPNNTDSKKKPDTSKTDSKKKDDTSKTDSKKKDDTSKTDPKKKSNPKDEPSKHSSHNETSKQTSQHETSEHSSYNEPSKQTSQHEPSKHSSHNEPSEHSSHNEPSKHSSQPEEESAFSLLMKKENETPPSEQTKPMGTATYARELGKKNQESLVTADSEEDENANPSETSDTKPAIKKSASQEFDDILNNPIDKQQDPKRFDDLFANTPSDPNSSPWSTFGTGTTPFGGSQATDPNANTFSDMFGSSIGGNNTSFDENKPAPTMNEIFGDDEDLLNFFNTDQTKTKENTTNQPSIEEID